MKRAINLQKLQLKFQADNPSAISKSIEIWGDGRWHQDRFFSILIPILDNILLPPMLIQLDMGTKKWTKIPWILGNINICFSTSCFIDDKGVLTVIGEVENEESKEKERKCSVFRVPLG